MYDLNKLNRVEDLEYAKKMLNIKNAEFVDKTILIGGLYQLKFDVKYLAKSAVIHKKREKLEDELEEVMLDLMIEQALDIVNSKLDMINY